MFHSITKRNMVSAPFDREKITNAIFRAQRAAGDADWQKAEHVTDLVLAYMEQTHSSSEAPTVEEVQDAVEYVLLNNGFAKIAKSYILYRQQRAALRKEKQQILNKEEIDEVDKRFDTNALRVLTSRYLRKNEEGNIIESPKELFTRVAVHTALPTLFYDTKVFAKGGRNAADFKPADYGSKQLGKKLTIGSYELNEFHKEGLVRLYNRFGERGKMKVSFDDFIGLFKDGYFDKYEPEIVEYYEAMANRRFMPNTPALANFGNYFGMGSACFVLDVQDDISQIMDTLKAASIIFKSGGGVGYNFSKLRPEGDYVKSTGGVASGPISFMSMFDNMTDVIKQGGIRRGANMGILSSNHPDILKFIKAKEGNKALRNFNISVLLTSDFWKYLEKKEPYPLINPRTGEVSAHVDPEQLFTTLLYQAWESAEPGVIFHDRVNEHNPFLKHLGPIVTTNPCGEVLLYPDESCNLGSVNVWSFVKKPQGGKPSFDWDGLAQTVAMATRFLDNVTDVNKYPLKQIEDMSLRTRKIGLGLMGLGDALYELELPYNGKAGLDFMEQLMEFINYHSKVQSVDLAKKRGPLPALKESFYPEGKLPFAGFYDKKSWHCDWAQVSRDIKEHGIRNGFTTVVAPTGSISMIAGCSSGIEPVYSLVFEKRITVGSFYYVDPVFEDYMQREGLMGDDLIKDVAASKGSVSSLSYIPPKAKKVFVTAHDITPKDHIHALAAFQKWVDSSISKTNNFPADATIDDVREAYVLAYKLGCKDVTVYRDGSIVSQVLVSGKGEKDKKEKAPASKHYDSLVPLKDEKVKGVSVYKDAAGQSEGGGDASATLMSYAPEAPEEKKEHKDGDDTIDFNGTVKCKLCNL